MWDTGSARNTRRNNLRIRIHYKIALVFCLITAFVLLGTFAYLDAVLKTYVYEKIKTAITKEVLLAKLFLEKDFPGYNRFKDISEISIKAGDQVSSRVSVIDINGMVLGDSDIEEYKVGEMENHLYRPEIQEALKKGIGESRRFSTTLGKDMLYIAAVIGKDSPKGFIRSAVPLTDIEVVSTRLKKILLAAVFAALFISAVFAFLAAFIITRPVNRIHAAAMELSRGNYDKKISGPGNDEIGDLAKAFNHMAEQIKLKVEEITSQSARFKAVLLSMSDGVVVVDKKENILLINDALKKIFPVTGDAFGKKPLEVVRNVEVQEIAESLLAGRESHIKKEISRILPEEKTVIVHGTPVVRDGNIEGAVMVFHDITEIRRLETVRRDFVANVSHELRTPASNIKGFAETLAAGALNDREHAAEFVKIIEENSDRLVRLIEDLLSLSRIESGKAPLDLKKCPVRDIIEKLEKETAKQAELKKIKFEKILPSNEIYIKADESMIFQALFNLADNAVKYTHENGHVKVTAREIKGSVEIEVSDDGPGIPEEHLERIFERFYRVDKSRSRETGSTGLGLSIVKHIAEEHGGSVRVESVFGKGSSFFLILPSVLT